jgi:phage protein D
MTATTQPATTQKLPDVALRYGDFFQPRFEVTAGGASLPKDVVRDVTSVSYNDSMTDIDSFDFTVNNWDDDRRRFKYVGSETEAQPSEALYRMFEPCARDFELSMGYGSNLVRMVKATPAGLEPSFPAGGAPTLTVRALNVLWKLQTKKYRGHWADKTFAQVVDEIAKKTEAGGCKRFPIPIRVSNEVRKDTKIDVITQENQFDIDFLLREGRERGYEVFVDQESASSRSPQDVLRIQKSEERTPNKPEIAYELKWGLSLIEFVPKLSTANQVKSVEVRGWDRQKSRPIRKTVTVHDSAIKINRDLLYLVDPGQPCGGTGCRPREDVTVNEPKFNAEQTQQRAVTLMEERLKQLVEATGSTVGIPELRAGTRVAIRGLGARFSGVYFVTKTTHTINDSGYVTKFTARRERPLDAA